MNKTKFSKNTLLESQELDNRMPWDLSRFLEYPLRKKKLNFSQNYVCGVKISPIKPSTVPSSIYSLTTINGIQRPSYLWHSSSLKYTQKSRDFENEKNWRCSQTRQKKKKRKTASSIGQLPTTLYFSSKALWCKRNPILSPPCGVLYSALYKNGIFRPILIYYYITSRQPSYPISKSVFKNQYWKQKDGNAF